ncbi:hypothetical protein [Taibaiella koreensis]|uniref:hypothetical protein n=1 Tax=Taibaiella koreensis TaxID=1268548 RepID=UPI0013C326CD|nr:hypothetical protein [Taibaiella koreensis]
MRKSISGVVISLCLVFVACKAKRVPALPPNVLFFQIKLDGQILDDSILAKVKLFYYDKNGNRIDSLPWNYDDRTFLFPASRSSGGLDGKGVLCSGYIARYIIRGEGVNTMYLEYPNADIDTLYVEVADIGSEAGARDRCYCDNPFTIVRFNGKDAPETTDIHTDNGKPIYLFSK